MTDVVDVECPKCGAVFATVAVGDVVACEECGDHFNRFTNIVDDAGGGENVECTVCGTEVGRGPGGLGQIQHANKHRREFREKHGRRPADYQEVRDVLGRGYTVGDSEQMTLAEALDDRARAARRDADQAGLEEGSR